MNPIRPAKDPWQIIAANDEVQAKIDTASSRDWQPVPPRFNTQMVRFHDYLERQRTAAGDDRWMHAARWNWSRRSINPPIAGADVALPIGPDSLKYADWRARTK